jgi:hypothetical protein
MNLEPLIIEAPSVFKPLQLCPHVYGESPNSSSWSITSHRVPPREKPHDSLGGLPTHARLLGRSPDDHSPPATIKACAAQIACSHHKRPGTDMISLERMGYRA